MYIILRSKILKIKYLVLLEVKDEITSVTNLATTTVLTAVENTSC